MKIFYSHSSDDSSKSKMSVAFKAYLIDLCEKKLILVGILGVIIMITFTGCSNQEKIESSNNQEKTDLASNQEITESVNDKEETGSFKKISIESDNYILLVKSSESGHPSGEYAFSTTSEIANKEYNNKSYNVTYNINYTYLKEKDVKSDYPDIDDYNKVKIDSKEFSYIMDNESINLIYQPQGMMCYLEIKVTLGHVFDLEGNLSNEIINISLDDLQNKEISDSIDFDIEKK